MTWIAYSFPGIIFTAIVYISIAGLSDLDRPFAPGSRLLSFLLPRTSDDASRPAGELGG